MRVFNTLIKITGTPVAIAVGIVIGVLVLIPLGIYVMIKSLWQLDDIIERMLYIGKEDLYGSEPTEPTRQT